MAKIEIKVEIARKIRDIIPRPSTELLEFLAIAQRGGGDALDAAKFNVASILQAEKFSAAEAASKAHVIIERLKGRSIEFIQPIGQVIGANPSTGEVSKGNLYSKIGESNLEEVFQTPLPGVGPDIYGTKAVVYIDDYGNPQVAFLTETVNTHHRHVLAFLIGGETGENVYGGEYTGDVLYRSQGYELQYDRAKGQIIGVKRDSQITTQQISRNIMLDKFMVDKMDNALLGNIDDKMLEDLLSSNKKIITEISGFEELMVIQKTI